MSNEHLGIFEELRRRREVYAQHIEARTVVPTGTVRLAYAKPAAPVRLRWPPRGRLRTVYPEALLGLRPSQVIAAVAAESDYSADELLGPSRVRKLAWRRHVALWLVDRYCQGTLAALGKMFGGRDHTSVMHAINQVDRRLKASEPITSHLVAAVQLRLEVK